MCLRHPTALDGRSGHPAETTLKARKVIEERKIRDWRDNRDVENSMIHELEEVLFQVKNQYDIPLTGHEIDKILGGVIRRVARPQGGPSARSGRKGRVATRCLFVDVHCKKLLHVTQKVSVCTMVMQNKGIQH